MNSADSQAELIIDSKNKVSEINAAIRAPSNVDGVLLYGWRYDKSPWL